VLDIVSVMQKDRSLGRVAQVEQGYGIGRRRLQRLFEKCIGASAPSGELTAPLTRMPRTAHGEPAPGDAANIARGRRDG